ncbi:MiaB/RimO family radical SAM methylthiotransferase [Candidatus Shapirobacteria bacterium]|nr:MiaB/RimO family radical SAM methylthiotransferase [Candidatus Shapirobacteria bacterium]
MKVYIKTFGCAQNKADSERIKAYYWEKGFETTEDWKEADEVVINTCIIRESAENRAYGLINTVNSYELRVKKKINIVVTGCLVGANQDKINKLKIKFPEVDEWAAIGKFLVWEPIRTKKGAALVSISTGCNNHCSFCIVPKARGKEVSRTMSSILSEIDNAIEQGFSEVVLIGQNVNSYGSDFGGESYVHMGKKRIKSMFPTLLENVAKKNLKKISFVSSNPWDFSDELIATIAKYPNIDRLLHLPFQAGNDEILKRMNRSYTKQEYLELVEKIKAGIKDVKFSTDIIIGFPGETDEQFEDTVDVCQKVGFDIAYLNKYSPRLGTVSAKLFKNDVSMKVKKERWVRLEELVNKKN